MNARACGSEYKTARNVRDTHSLTLVADCACDSRMGNKSAGAPLAEEKMLAAFSDDKLVSLRTVADRAVDPVITAEARADWTRDGTGLMLVTGYLRDDLTEAGYFSRSNNDVADRKRADAKRRTLVQFAARLGAVVDYAKEAGTVFSATGTLLVTDARWVSGSDCWHPLEANLLKPASVGHVVTNRSLSPFYHIFTLPRAGYYICTITECRVSAVPKAKYSSFFEIDLVTYDAPPVLRNRWTQHVIRSLSGVLVFCDPFRVMRTGYLGLDRASGKPMRSGDVIAREADAPGLARCTARPVLREGAVAFGLPREGLYDLLLRERDGRRVLCCETNAWEFLYGN